MLQSQNTLFVSHFYKRTPHNIFINNETGNIITLKSDSSNKIGSWNSFPVNSPQWSYNESFIYDIQAIYWTEILQRLDEDAKTRMRNLITGFKDSELITVNDNPVLVYFKMKDF